MEVVTTVFEDKDEPAYSEWHEAALITGYGFICVNSDWKIRFFNKTAALISGLTHSSVTGKNFWDVLRNVIPHKIWQHYSKVAIANIPPHFSQYWPHPGGWIIAHTYFFKNTLSISFKLAKDQVSLHATPSGIKVLNTVYQFMTQVTNSCLWDWNLRTHEIFWIDGGHKRLFGYQFENCVVPQSFWENRIHVDDRMNLISQLHKISSSNFSQTLDYEYRFRKANGEYAFIHDRARIIRNQDNISYRIIGASNDVTSKKLAEIKLLEAENRLTLIIEQMVNAILIVSPKLMITYLNGAFTNITGYDEAEMLNKNLLGFLNNNHSDRITLSHIRKSIRDQQHFSCEISLKKKSGEERWVFVQGQPLHENDRPNEKFVVVLTDITEKVLERQKRTAERLAVQNRIASAVFTALEEERKKVSAELHDNINHTLVACKLYVEMALTKEDKNLTYLTKSSGYIAKAIEDIRKLSRGLINHKLLTLFQNIQGIIDDIMMIHPIRIKFRHKLIHEEKLDEKLRLNIFRIVQEQLTNIIKHSHAKKAIITLEAANNLVKLTITDDGVGSETPVKMNGVGLQNIVTRAQLFNGKVDIVCSPGNGFKLEIAFVHP